MVLAGLHIGQDAVSDGGRIGAQTTSADAQRLLQVFERLQPQRLVVLGPVFRERADQPTGAAESDLVAWFRKSFSGQLDVVRSDVEKGTPSPQQQAGTQARPQWRAGIQPSQWTNALQIGPFYFSEWRQHSAPDTTGGASFVIAAQRGDQRAAASETTDHPHFCVLEDALLLAPFSDAALQAHGAECRGQRAAIVNGTVAWGRRASIPGMR
jgi:hypothetical protein